MNGTVHVIAPSGPLSGDWADRGLAHVRRRFGEPTLAANLRECSGYFAGDDDERLRGIETALRDDAARIVWAVRGGYGATRLLSRLDPSLLRPPGAPPKILVGFSDVTALLCWAWSRARLPSIHGPVVTQLDLLPPEDLERLWDLLDGEIPPPLVAEAPEATALHGGRVEGTLIPANLEVLRSLAGTPFMPDLRGAILALEDVGERPYRLDRALTQLLESGALRGVVGVAVGDLHGCVEPQDGGSRGWSAVEVFAERLGRLGVPLVTGFPFGHAPGRNAALPFGVRGRLDASGGTLEVLEPVHLLC
ncbi:MAG: LD-carboxypeptidase [Myxococcales bacterium]|nr:LD-carboxypeptidase [Myxococcales bacterium]